MRFEMIDETGRVVASAVGGAGALLKALGEADALEKGKPQSAPVDDRAPHFGAHHADLAASSEPGDPDHDANQVAAGHMRAGDQEALASHLRGLDTGQRDHVLNHIHPDHWEGLGFRPLNPDEAKASFGKRFGPGKGAPEKAKTGTDPRGKAKSGAGKAAEPKPSEEKPMRKSILLVCDASLARSISRE